MMLDGLRSIYAKQNIKANIRLYCLATDRLDSRIYIVSNVQSLAVDKFYQTSDVIIVHFGFISTIFEAIIFAPFFATKILFYHGITPPHLLAEDQFNNSVNSYRQLALFSGFDAIATTTNYIANDLKKISFDHIPILPCGLPLKFPLTSVSFKDRQNFSITYLGRFVEHKNVDILIKSFFGIHLKYPEARLRLCGSATYSDSKYLDRLFSLISSLGLTNVIQFYFDISNSELCEILSQSSTLVLPSSHEGFGMPVFEALSAGCPCIISNIQSLAEITRGLALSFDIMNPPDLRDKLFLFFDSYQQGKILTDSGEVDYSEWKTQIDNILAFYDPDLFISRLQSLCVSRKIQPDIEIKSTYTNNYIKTINNICSYPIHVLTSNKFDRELCELTPFPDTDKLMEAFVDASDSDFICTLYRELLKREIDFPAYEDKLVRIKDDRSKIFLEILESDELLSFNYSKSRINKLKNLVVDIASKISFSSHSISARDPSTQLFSNSIKDQASFFSPQIKFDEKVYISSNPDVKLAVESGEFSSAFEHWLKFGIFENRRFF